MSQAENLTGYPSTLFMWHEGIGNPVIAPHDIHRLRRMVVVCFVV
jgi:hypothetical protein